MNIYDIRRAGREFCQTEGSEHYKSEGKIEPIELTFSVGHAEGFCIGNILKYAARFPKTQNLQDLKKASDYAQILVGLKLGEPHGIEAPNPSRPLIVKCGSGYCYNGLIDSKDKAEFCINKDFEVCKWRMAN